MPPLTATFSCSKYSISARRTKFGLRSYRITIRRKFDVVVAGPEHRADLLNYFESRVAAMTLPVLPHYRASDIRLESCEELHMTTRLSTCAVWVKLRLPSNRARPQY